MQSLCLRAAAPWAPSGVVRRREAGVRHALEDLRQELDMDLTLKFSCLTATGKDELISESQRLLGVTQPVRSSWTGVTGEPVRPHWGWQQPGGPEVRGRDSRALQAVRWASLLQQSGHTLGEKSEVRGWLEES